MLGNDPNHKSSSNLHAYSSEHQNKTSTGFAEQYEIVGSGDKYHIKIDHFDDPGFKDSVTKFISRLDEVFPGMFKYHIKKKIMKGTYDIFIMDSDDMKQKGRKLFCKKTCKEKGFPQEKREIWDKIVKKLTKLLFC